MGLEPTTSWTTTRGYHQLSYGHRVPSGYRYQQAVAEVEFVPTDPRSAREATSGVIQRCRAPFHHP